MGAAFFQSPALWGFLGAFIYAAPRLIAGAVAARQAGRGPWVSAAEFLAAIVTGAIAAAAFGPPTAGLAGRTAQQDLNAICALWGLVFNRAAPQLVESLSSAVTNVISGRILKGLKGDDK